MDRQKKMLFITILAIALIQMPTLALTPAIEYVRTVAFPGSQLSAVQTVFQLPNLVSPFIAIGSAFFINRRIVTKKWVIITGLLLLAATGLLSLVLHTEFWHLCLLNIVLGIALGCFVSNAFGLLFDNYTTEERQTVAGYQTSCINAGGIAMSVFGGLLATLMWYSSYLVLLIGLPVAVLAFFAVPNYKTPLTEPGTNRVRVKLPPKVFYYAALVFLYMMAYNVCGNNISTHIAGFGNSATAGICMAIQMAGGVLSGVFFGKLSKKFGDYLLTLSFLAVFIGYMLLSLFPMSLAVTFAAVLITGLTLSIMLPRCILMVSTLVDQAGSATATAIISSIAPSFGGFLSPVIFTNIGTSLFGHSTALHFRFVSLVVLAFAAAVTVITVTGNRKSTSEKVGLL